MRGDPIGPSGGPKNRYKKANAKQDRQKRRERQDLSDEKRAADAEAAGEPEYKCRSCQTWWPLEAFQYEHDNQTKVATRCESCRRGRNWARARQAGRLGL